MRLELLYGPEPPEPYPGTLLFVHDAWHAAWCWQEHFIPYFARHRYRTAAVSLRGHGGSEGHEQLRWTSIADYVADLETTAGHLAPPLVLIGHSMGGLIVQHYLRKHRARAAVLLASIPPTGVMATTLRIAQRYPLRFARANLTLSLYPLVDTPDQARAMLFSPQLPKDRLLLYFPRLQDESYRAYVDMLGLNLPRPRRIATPVLVLGAAQDAIVSPGEVAATARAYRTRAAIFSAMGHDMMLEVGWQAVADYIAIWLQALPG
jgi:pimeloyl-ACP methyl ester carboxylesterase